MSDTFFVNFLGFSFSTLITSSLFAPLERMKLIFQTQNLSKPNERFTSYKSAYKDIFKNQGLFSFWRGNYILLLKDSFGFIFRYPLFDYLQKNYKLESNINKIPCLLSTAFISFVFVYPLDVLRIRFAKDMTDNESRNFKGIFSSIIKIVKTEGFSGLVKGFRYSAFTLIPNISISLFIYDNMNQYTKEKEFSNIERISIFGLTGFLIQFFTFPFDTIRRKLQVNGGSDHLKLYINSSDCIKKCFKFEGIKGFYSGFIASSCKNIPQLALQMTIYENSKQYLNQNFIY